MILRVCGFGFLGALAGVLIGLGTGYFLSGPAPAPVASPAERSQFVAERVSEMLNCGAAFGALGIPVGGCVGWLTARKSAAAR